MSKGLGSRNYTPPLYPNAHPIPKCTSPLYPHHLPIPEMPPAPTLASFGIVFVDSKKMAFLEIRDMYLVVSGRILSVFAFSAST
jgi:hypothetical protein